MLSDLSFFPFPPGQTDASFAPCLVFCGFGGGGNRKKEEEGRIADCSFIILQQISDIVVETMYSYVEVVDLAEITYVGD